ncbi:hypothetical protein LSAT2_014909, partial [Lamellibrachia satsuma]
PNCTASSDCLNDGTCHTNNCHCTDGYIGDHCETEFQCTKDADCLNDGTCPPENTKPCDCTLGYVGANCALKYNCDTRSPCFTANLVNGFYFEQSDPHKFIQCDANGGCYDKSCPENEVWKQETPGCASP